MPEGWEFEDPWYTSHEDFGAFADDVELNVRESVTQFSTATIKQYGDHMVFVSNFEFPFDYQFLRDMREGKSQANPYLIF